MVRGTSRAPLPEVDRARLDAPGSHLHLPVRRSVPGGGSCREFVPGPWRHRAGIGGIHAPGFHLRARGVGGVQATATEAKRRGKGTRKIALPIRMGADTEPRRSILSL